MFALSNKRPLDQRSDPSDQFHAFWQRVLCPTDATYSQRSQHSEIAIILGASERMVLSSDAESQPHSISRVELVTSIRNVRTFLSIFYGTDLLS